MEPQILLIIPCYNEASRLPTGEYVSFLSNNSSVAILFVNDGSTDDTLALLNDIHNQFPNQTEILNLEKNSGKAEAIRQGFLKSTSNSVFYIGYFDADLATPLSESLRMLEVNKKLDKGFLMGARVDLYGSTTIKRNIVRHYLGRIFATIISNVLGLSIYDTQCGAKILKKDLADNLFQEPFISKWLFDIELILRLKKLLGKENIHQYLAEIPLKSWEEKGSSKVSPFFLFRIPFEILWITIKYR